MSVTLKAATLLLLKHLRHFNTSGDEVDSSTPFEKALSNHRVVGTSPRSMFKAMCRHDLVGNGAPDVDWPSDWASQTCDSLAPQLI